MMDSSLDRNKAANVYVHVYSFGIRSFALSDGRPNLIGCEEILRYSDSTLLALQLCCRCR